jgi:hypothetical protein
MSPSFPINSYTKNQVCPNCSTATKKEKMTGAVFMVNAFSEHEECRVCLNPGLKRRCCGNYYCDECYYKVPLCRSCKAPVGQKAESIFDSARIIPIFLGILVTIFVSTLLAGGTFLALTNDYTTPVGVNDYKCYGFFPKCDLSLCIDVHPATANGSRPMAPIHTYRSCTLKSLSKIYSTGCVFDKVLYEDTNGMYGYDIC